MWAAKLPGEGAKMYDACVAMCDIMNVLKIAVDGGKDSLSMAARIDGETVKSPGTLVISTYVQCPDIRKKVTPDFKAPQQGKVGELVWVNIEGLFRMGGSVLAQSYAQQGNDVPDISKPEILRSAFIVTQHLLDTRKVLAGHDISDGGLITCLLEMAFTGLCGLKVDLTSAVQKLGVSGFPLNQYTDPALLLLFAEECGWVLEVTQHDLASVLEAFDSFSVPAYHIGQSIGRGLKSSVDITYKDRTILSGDTLTYFKQWERTSFELEKLQIGSECATEEFQSYDYRTGPSYRCTINPCIGIPRELSSPIRVAVIREEGTNGDREMMSTLINARFEPHDVTMADLLLGKTHLDRYRGVVFPGGFSYGDTLGSAKGWAASIMYSAKLAPQFASFKNRKDTFSLGICNGCQLMSLIGWVGVTKHADVVDVPDVALLENRSQRFECRWATVKIAKSRSIMLNRLAGSTIGVWIAHGEGRFSFRTEEVKRKLIDGECIGLHYVDDSDQATEVYPMNPNGSVGGVAAICSMNGRHLAMMPHPERCSEMWQWPYVSPGFVHSISPWQTMFDDAFIWCTK